MTKGTARCDVGLVGLGVMGRNLVLNLADHGHRVAVYNRTTSVMREFVGEHGDDPFPDGGAVEGFEALADFVESLRTPRIIVVLVKAGPAVDKVCEQLLEAGVAPDDIVVDGGNSRWTDTIRRDRDYRGRLTFFGSGISGGEVGARFGPSLMPGGDEAAWQRLRPVWESIAAKVDPETGRPLLDAEPGRPVAGGEPCAAYLGPDGAGHYVKMVHNGIEYADMQLIAEAYALLRRTGLSPAELADVFAGYNRGELESFLIEITADILRQEDPVTGSPIVDVILDAAGMKGTGTWTAIDALELGAPATAIAEAVMARAISARKDERVAASRVLRGPGENVPGGADLVEAVGDALYCSKICAYAQGFQLLRAAQEEYDWNFDFGAIAKIWRGGCIIRAVFLQKITDAYGRAPDLVNLLLDPFFAGELARRQAPWRRVVAAAVTAGVPCPAFASALAYYDACRSETLPANLLQAQRDYFGAHTFERTDRPRGRHFHLDWPAQRRQLVEA